MSTRSEPIFDPAAQVSALNAPERRQNLVRILFVNRCLGDVERCLQELKRLRFTVSSDVVLTPEQFVERLRVDVYDTIVAEHPSPNWMKRKHWTSCTTWGKTFRRCYFCTKLNGMS